MRWFRWLAGVAPVVLLIVNTFAAGAVQSTPLPSSVDGLVSGTASGLPITFKGFVRVIDGDTIEVLLNGRRAGIGIVGVDAPQGNTACGRAATQLLRQLVAGGVKLEDDPDPTLRLDASKRRLFHLSTLTGGPIDQALVNAGDAKSDGRGADRSSLASLEGAAKGANTGCLWGPPSIGNKLSSIVTDNSQLPPAVESVAAPTTFQTGFVQDVVTGGLVAPTAMTMLPDGRMLIAEKNGIVRLFKNGAIQATPFIDLRDRVNDYWDHGLLGMAVDPNFATNGYIYLLYTYENNSLQYDGTKTARLARYTAVGDAAAPTTESVVLGTVVGASCQDFPAGTDCIPSDGPSHGVGALKFAPDGTLFATVGESGSFNFVDDLSLRAQDIDSLAGKVIHITTTGAGLASNPFYNGSTGANRSKVWAMGVRNAYRFDIDPVSGVPYVGDVGWDTKEEIDAAVAGANLGWPCYEGNAQQPGFAPKTVCQALYAQGTSAVRFALYEYDHCQLFCGSTAVTGGVFYTGTTYPAQYRGLYFFGDYGQGFIRYLRADASHNLVPGSVGELATSADGPVDFKMGLDGNIYYLAINAGELRRIRYNASTSSYLSDLAWTSMTNGWGPAEKDKSNGEQGAGDGNTLTLNGTTYAKGLGVHAASDIRYAVGSTCSTFTAQVGVDDEVGTGGSVDFQVFGDTTQLYDSGVLTGASATKSVSVDVTGRTTLRLVVTDGGNGVNYDHGDWADAQLACAGDTTPPTVTTIFPADGATGVAQASSLAATFSEPVDPSTITASTFSVAKGATAVAATVSYDIPSNTATLNPTADLEPATVYTATVKGGLTGVKDVVGNPLAVDKVWTFTTAAVAGNVTYLSDLTWTSMTNGWGPVEKDRSNGDLLAGDGAILTLNGQTFAKGLGAHATSDVRYAVGSCRTFTAQVGVDDEVGSNGSVIFQVYADLSKVFDSGLMTGATATKSVSVDLTGATTLRLVVTDGGNGIDYDHADWADAKFDCIGAPPPPLIFGPPTSFPSGTNTHGVAIADLNGDGKWDIVGGNAGANNVGIRLGNGDGTFGAVTTFAVGTTPKNVAVGDLNGDGKLDIVTADQDSSTMSVLLGNGAGGFGTATAYPMCSRPHDAGIGDFNGDGKPDVAVVCWGGQAVSIRLGNGDGTFGPKVDYPVGAFPLSVTIADFDRDGKLDLAVANNGGASVSILRGVGDGTFVLAANLAVAPGPHSIRSADLNGDGKIDLVTADQASDQVSVLLGNGNGTFNPSLSYLTGKSPRGVAVGDVNGDGKLDLVTANTGSNYPTCCSPGGNTVTVLLGNGDGTFGIGTPYTAGTTPFNVALADLDGDNDLDLVSANWDSGDITVLKNISVSGPDTTPPTVTAVVPLAGATGVGVATIVSATFSEAIDPATVSTSTVTLAKAGTAVAASVTYDGASKTVSLDPTATLEAGVTYTATVKGGASGVKDLAANALVADKVWTFTTAAAAGGTTSYVSDLTWTSMTNGWGPVEKDKSNGEQAAGDGHTLTLNGTTFAKGLGTHAASDVRYALNGCTSFTAQVGVDDEVGANGSVAFQVFGDTTKLYDSGVMTGATATTSVSVDLTGKTSLGLVVTNGGDNLNYDHGDWADAKVTCGNTPPVPTITSAHRRR